MSASDQQSRTRKNVKKAVMRQVVQFSKEQVYALVSDVECYPDFVPFCCTCKLVEDEKTEEEQQWCRENPEAELRFASTTIGFKAFNETYISRIKCYPHHRVEAYSNDSKLFYLMVSIWEFKEVEGCPDQCEICFTTEFEFRSALYSQVASYFLEFVANKNMEAFIARLNIVYGQVPSTTIT